MKKTPYLQHLEKTQLVQLAQMQPELEYIFCHALIQDTAYESLLQSDRREIHQTIGDTLERLYPARLNELAPTLGRHFALAQKTDKAISYFILAGDNAAEVYAWQEAIQWYEQALALIPQGKTALRAELFKKLTKATIFTTEIDDSLRFALTALALYEELEDKQNLIEVNLLLMMLHSGMNWDGAKENKALGYLQRLSELIEDEPDNMDKILVYSRIAHTYLHMGNPLQALAGCQKTLDLSKKLNIPMGTSFGTIQAYLGQLEAGFRHSENNWDTVRTQNNVVIISVFGHELVLTLTLAKDTVRAQKWGEMILDYVKEAGPIIEGQLRRPLILLYTLIGNHAKATELAQIELQVESNSLIGCYYECSAGVGSHYWQQGEWEKATSHLAKLLSSQEERHNWAAVSGCCFVLGKLALAKEAYVTAEQYLLRSLNITRTGRNVLFELWLLPLLVELSIQQNELEVAAEYVERGFDLMQPDQQWYGLPATMYLAQGMLATASGEWQKAESAFVRGMEVGQQYELRADEAHLFFEWGKMYQTRDEEGDKAKALEKLAQAHELWQQMAATRATKKVEAQIARLTAA